MSEGPTGSVRTQGHTTPGPLARLSQLAMSPLLRLSLLALALLFLALVLRGQWRELLLYRPVLRLWPLLGSYALLFPAMLLEVWLWRRLLTALGSPLPLRRASGIWFSSNLVRYVPGNVWQFLGMMELGAQSGIRRSTVLLSILLHQVLSNLAGLCIGAYAIGYSELGGSGWIPAAAAGFVAALLFSPWALPRLLRLLNRAVGGADERISLTPRLVVVLFCGYCLYWLIAGGAFWLMSTALFASSPPGALAWASAYAAAYVIGYLSLLTPSGLGVREGVLALLLAPLLAGAPGAVPALAARVWATVGEAVASAVAVAADRRFLLRARPH